MSKIFILPENEVNILINKYFAVSLGMLSVATIGQKKKDVNNNTQNRVNMFVWKKRERLGIISTQRDV